MPTTMSRIQDDRLTGAVALAVALVGIAFANFVAGGENGGTPEFFGTAAILTVIALVLFGRVLPATDAPAKVAIWCAALALVTLVVFWSGLPMLLGIAAVAAGARASSTAGTAAAVVGGLVATVGTVGCIIG